MPDEDFTSAGLEDAARRGRVADWVAAFLASAGSDNPELADALTRRCAVWVGPVRLPLDELHRLAGGEGTPALVEIDDEAWAPRVEDMAEKARHGWEPPPLVVTYRHHQLVLEDGNHRAEALRRAGSDQTWCVVGFDDPAAHREYLDAGWPRPEDVA